MSQPDLIKIDFRTEVLITEISSALQDRPNDFYWAGPSIIDAKTSMTIAEDKENELPDCYIVQYRMTSVEERVHLSFQSEALTYEITEWSKKMDQLKEEKAIGDVLRLVDVLRSVDPPQT